MAIGIDANAGGVFAPLPVQEPRRFLSDFREDIRHAAAIAEAHADPRGARVIGRPRVLPPPPPIEQGQVGLPGLQQFVPEPGMVPEGLADLLTAARGRVEIAALVRQDRADAVLAVLQAGGILAPAPAEALSPAELPAPLAEFAPPPLPARAERLVQGLLADADRVAERIVQLNAAPALAAARAATALADVAPPRRPPVIDQVV